MNKGHLIIQEKNEITIADIKQNLPIEKIDLPFAREIYLFTSYIAGVSHIEHVEDIINRLNIDDKLIFKREIDNAYDSQAIRIETIEHHKIGYVPKNDNVIFSRLMDAGKMLFGKVKNIDKKSIKYYRIDIDIYLKD